MMWIQGRRAAMLLGGALLLVVAGLFVWPTPYRELAISSSTPSVLAAREQRFTHRVDVLTRFGWKPLGPLPSASSDPVAEYLAKYGAPDSTRPR